MSTICHNPLRYIKFRTFLGAKVSWKVLFERNPRRVPADVHVLRCMGYSYIMGTLRSLHKVEYEMAEIMNKLCYLFYWISDIMSLTLQWDQYEMVAILQTKVGYEMIKLLLKNIIENHQSSTELYTKTFSMSFWFCILFLCENPIFAMLDKISRHLTTLLKLCKWQFPKRDTQAPPSNVYQEWLS